MPEDGGKDSMCPAVKTMPAGAQIGCPPAEKIAPRAESPPLRQTLVPFSFRKHTCCRVHKNHSTNQVTASS